MALNVVNSLLSEGGIGWLIPRRRTLSMVALHRPPMMHGKDSE